MDLASIIEFFQRIILGILLLLFVALMFVAAFFVMGIMSSRQEKRIKKALGNDIEIEYNFPIKQMHERIIHGALKKLPQGIRIVVTGSDWLFAQPSHNTIPLSTSGDHITVYAVTICAFHLRHYSPEIAIQHRSHRNILSDSVQQEIASGELVRCEGAFEAKQRIYATPNTQLDVLSILSPEVLVVMQHPPFDADLYIKRDQLYYLFHTDKQVEKVMPSVIKHAEQVRVELEDNLARWARSASNQEKVAIIKNTPLAYTLRELHESDS